MPRKRVSLDKYSINESARLLREVSGREHALLAGRGAAGIVAALGAFGLREKWVGIPANTCYIVLWAVLKSGNFPYLLDVDSTTGNITLEQLQATGYRLSALIPCHLYGLPAPMESICAWAKANNIFVIEDAALALGAVVDGKPAGSWGDVSIFSFGAGKIIDNDLGGAVLTDDARLAAEIEAALKEMPLWSNDFLGMTQQWNDLYWALHQHESTNPKLAALHPKFYSLFSELVAYQLPADYWRDLPDTLRGLGDNLKHRAEMTALYDALLLPTFATLPRPADSILWKYPLQLPPGERDAMLAHLWANGIHEATRWYPSLQTIAAALSPEITQPPTPNADAVAASIINLPLHPGMDETVVRQVAAILMDFERR